MADNVIGGRVIWEFDVDKSRFDRKTDEAKTQAKKFGNDVNKINFKKLTDNAAKGFDQVANSIKRAAIISGATIGAIGAFSVKSAIDVEQNRIAFETMLGSADAARKMMQELSDFAVSTPFELPQVQQGAKQLLAYGIAAEEILPDFESLGNITAAVGRDKLPFLTLAFGQVATKGKLAGQEVRQFTEAGVPLVQQLADSMGRTTAEITEMVSAGKIGFEDVRKAIRDMSGEGGRFEGLMERQSKTLGGVFSNIRDQLGRTARSVLGITEAGDVLEDGLFNKISNAAKTFLDFLDNNQESINRWFSIIIDNAVPAVTGLVSAFVALKATLAVLAIGKVVVAFVQFFKALKTGKGVMVAFNAVTAANPFVAIAAAIAVLVGGLVFLQLKFKIFNRIWDTIKGAFGAVVGFFKRNVETFKKILLGVGAAFLLLFSPLTLLAIIVVKNFETIKTVITTILGKVLEVITTVFTSIFNIVTTVISSIWNVIRPVLEFILNLFIIIFGSILIVVLTILNVIFGVIQTIFRAIVDVISTVLNGIITVVTTIFNAMFTVISTVVTTIFNVVKTGFTKVFNFFKSIFNKIFGIVKSIVNRIIDFFRPAVTWLVDKGKAVIQGLVNGIRSMVNALVNAVKFVSDKIGKFFSGVGRWLFDSGKALFQGFIDGMKAIGDKVKDTASSIVSSVRDLLPFSPAKEGPFSGRGWTKFSGAALIEGLAEGIMSAQGSLQGAVNQALGGVSSQFEIATSPSISTDEIVSGTSVVNSIQEINISDEVDGENWLRRLTRDEEITSTGLTPNEN